MKLKERRYTLVFHYLKEYLLDTEKDVDVLITSQEYESGVRSLWPDITNEELVYGIRHLIGKGFLKTYSESMGTSQIALTQKGIDE